MGYVNGIKAERDTRTGERKDSDAKAMAREAEPGMFHRESNFVKTLADTRLY